MKAQSYKELTAAINVQMTKQVQEVLSEITNATALRTYKQEGLGDFPYWLTTGPSGSFNKLTYRWINQVVKFDEANNTLRNAGETMTGQLATVVYPKLSYELNAADRKKLRDTTTATIAEGRALISQYTQNIASIPGGTKNHLNYVVEQIQTWGKGGKDNPIGLVKLKNTFGLNQLLSNMPASGSAVLPAFTQWLNAASSTLSLQDAVSFGNNFIRYLKNAVTAPNKKTSISTLDPKNVSAEPVSQPKWTINNNANGLLNSLKNAEKKVSISISASNSTSTTTDLSINGNAIGTLGLSWLTFGGSGSVSYNVHTANSSQANAIIEISYPGITVVAVEPMSAKRVGSSAEGWMDRTVLTQAVNHGSDLPPKTSGYIFSPALPEAISLSTDGNFGYLNTVVISAQPTIKITYKSGDSSIYKHIFEQKSDWSLDLFGLFTIKASQSYYKARVKELSSNSGFTVIIKPDASQFTVPDAEKRAKVLAAAVTWPGDAS